MKEPPKSKNKDKQCDHGVDGEGSDIPDRKNIKRELQETKALFKGMLDGLTDIVGLLIPDYTVICYNKAVCETQMRKGDGSLIWCK